MHYINNSNESKEKIIQAIKENDQEDMIELLKNNNKVKDVDFTLDINKGNNQIEERDDNFVGDRVSLLHIAAYYDSLECFCYLHEISGINLQIQSIRNFYPLHYACYNGSKEVASYILAKDQYQTSLVTNNSFLCFTIHGGCSDILEELFRNGSKIIKSQSRFDDPIEKALFYNNFKCCEILMKHIEEYQAYLTPAITAARTFNPELIKFLVKGPEDLEFSPHCQKSVFTIIFDQTNGQNFKELIMSWVTHFPYLRIEPPDDIASNGVVHWVCMLCDPILAAKMLETPDVDVNRIGLNDHIGPFYFEDSKNAKDDDQIKILELLIANGYDVNMQVPGRTIETPLKVFLKMVNLRYKVIDFLIRNGADPNLPWADDPSYTILDEVKKRKNNQKIMSIFEDFIKK